MKLPPKKYLVALAAAIVAAVGVLYPEFVAPVKGAVDFLLSAVVPS